MSTKLLDLFLQNPVSPSATPPSSNHTKDGALEHQSTPPCRCTQHRPQRGSSAHFLLPRSWRVHVLSTHAGYELVPLEAKNLIWMPLRYSPGAVGVDMSHPGCLGCLSSPVRTQGVSRDISKDLPLFLSRTKSIGINHRESNLINHPQP